MFAFIKRLLFGRPIATARQKHERLPKFLALPVFSSDAISSTAYATEEILLAFSIAGIGALAWRLTIPVTAAIVLLLAIVVTSYRQTIFSYPQGGGSYIVTKENLGIYPGLIAAASLLTDYILTVAVSISSGVAAITSMAPQTYEYRVLMAVGFVLLVALMNLRGLRESGTLFAVPTYGFIACIGIMIIAGFYKLISFKWFGGAPIVHVHESFPKTTAGTDLTLFAIIFVAMKAFAGGCSAMTGTEAVADGIPSFRPPESKNAAATLVYMAIILGFLFLGISTLAYVYQAMPTHGGHETVVSQIARAVFGRGKFYYLLQVMTAAILVLAANTAYQDYPRLSSILARDRFAPRQFASIGDRLVFNNGIIVLSVFAIFLVVFFKASTHALIPLYAIGVFISFTLSQFSMSRRLVKLKQPRWHLFSWISRIGSMVTLVVVIVIASMKFRSGEPFKLFHWMIPTGAYIVLIIIPIVVLILYKIHQHYIELGNQLRITEGEPPRPVRSTAIVLTSGIHKGILSALEYAKALSHDCRALYIEIDPSETPLIRDRWEKFGLGVPLVILESPFRSIVGPTLEYLEEAKLERPNHIVTVVLPEFVPRKWWHKLLHTQSGFFLKIMLMFRRDIVVTNVRYYLER